MLKGFATDSCKHRIFNIEIVIQMGKAIFIMYIIE